MGERTLLGPFRNSVRASVVKVCPGPNTYAVVERDQTIAQSKHIKITLLLASSMSVMAAAIIAPSLPGMGQHFTGHSDVLIKLILTMPALLIALSGAPLGHLADRFGRKRLLLISLLLYGAAGFSGYWAESLVALLAGRAVLGVAVAGIISMSTTLIGDYFEPGERARFLGFQGSFMVLGGLLFLNLGGVLAEWNWRGPFIVYLASIALLPMAARVLYEPKREPAERAGAPRCKAPVDRPTTALVYILAMLGMMLLYVVPTQLPFFLAEKANIGSAAVGFAISTTTLTSAVVSFFYGRIQALSSFAGIYAAAFFLIAAGYLVVGIANSYAIVTLGVALSGFGLGLFMPNGAVWLMSITSERARGRIIGGYTSMLFLGQFLSPLAVAPLAALSPSLGYVFLAAAAIAVALAVVLFALSRTLLGVDYPSPSNAFARPPDAK